MTQQDFYQKQFHVDIREITLVTETGNEIDLRPLLVQLNIYEDLFTPTLTGNIILSDQHDLIGKMPIYGRESISIKFKTPGLKNNTSFIQKTFTVYKVGDINKDQEQKFQTYTLFFASKEFIENARQIVSKSYSGTPSEIIQRVFTEYFEDGILNEVSQTKNKVSFVCPGWKPLTLINWLTDVAVSQQFSDSHRFSFYETFDGFYLKDISEMINQEVEYIYSANDNFLQTSVGVNTTDAAKKYSFFNQIVSMDVISSFDPYTRLKRGVYSNTVLHHDITNKKYGFSLSDYNTEFVKTNHVYNNPITTFTDDLFVSPNSMIMYLPLSGNETDYQLSRANRITQMNLISDQKIAITVRGNHSLRVGKMINVSFPRNVDFTETKDDKEINDETFSGNYLISAVHHTITGNGYSCRVELIRDSLFRPLPDAVKVKDGDKTT